MRNSLLMVFIWAGAHLAAAPYASLPSWEEVKHLRQEGRDVLYSGRDRELRGNLAALPSLKYGFGTLSFSPQDLAAVVVLEDGRLQYVGENGASYIADAGEGELIFKADSGVAVPLQKGNFIFLKRSSKNDSDAYSVVFEDGTRLAASLTREAITISDGWEESSLPPAQVAKLSKSEGVFVCRGKHIEKMEGAFVRDRMVTLRIPKANLTVRLPWDKIEKIESRTLLEHEDLVSYLLPLLPVGRRERLAPGSNPAEERLSIYFKLPDRYMTGLTLPQPTVSQGLGTVALTPKQVMAAIDRLDVITLVDALSLEAWKSRPHPLFEEGEDFGAPTDVVFLDSLSKKFSLENLALVTPSEKDSLEELVLIKAKPAMELAAEEGLVSMNSLLDTADPIALVEDQLKEEMLQEGMVYIEGGDGVASFYIGLYQVSGGDYQEFLDDTGYPPPPGGVGDDMSAVVGITYQDALAYAKWKKMTLPTARQWEYAVQTNLIEPGSETQYEWVLEEEGERVIDKGPEPFKPGFSEQVTGFRLVLN